MSEERIGKNGKIVGTAAYFEEINKNSMMVGILTDLKEHHYLEQLDLLAQRVCDTLDEMCDDLERNANVLPYFAESIRMETAKFVHGIDDILRFLRKSSSKADSCLSLLYLRDFHARIKSRASVREVLEAAAKIQKEGGMWQSDVESMLKKARDYGLRDLSGGDEKKIEFIRALGQEDDRDFYDDVLRLLEYRDRPDHFKGKGGKILCSKEYFDYFAKKIFTAEIPMRYLPRGDNYEYAANLKYALDGIRDIIMDDLSANGDFLSVENINKLKLVSDDMEKLIGKGFSDKLTSVVTDVANVDGLVIDRDYEVLSEDDLALVKALSNEYLWYEQEGNEPVMEALAYEVVKIRQKAVYYDQYNRGPYLNREGYEGNIKVGIKVDTMCLGDVFLHGGKTEDTDKMEEVRKEVSVGKLGNVFDFLLFFSRLDKVERAKAYLEIGDIWIQISDDTYTLGEERHSWYKRDGKYIASTRDYLNVSNPSIPSIINPDLELESQWEMFKEYLKDKTEDKLLDIIQKGITKNIK